MKLVIFGLTISSSWGNGHATLWRGLCGALIRRGHKVAFFERDVPYYASHRDLRELPGGMLYLYPEWDDALPTARKELRDADVAMITSYCFDAASASDLVLSSLARARVFYDLDTPVTLDSLRCGTPVSYIGPRGLRDYDLVLSYTGGEALNELRTCLGARRVAPLYGSVEPEMHKPVPASDAYRADLSYLGTYAEDRQATLSRLFVEPARRMPERKFLLGGSLYPEGFPWTENMYYVRHVSPPEHSAFYCSSTATLNVTRGAMASMGYCPSGRLFEAAACGTPILSDWWEGLNRFFEPGVEILVARTPEDVMEALTLPREELAQVAARARRRALEDHTADARASELERLLEGTMPAMAA